MFDNNIKGISDGNRLFMHSEKENLMLSMISYELYKIKKIIIEKSINLIVFFII